MNTEKTPSQLYDQATRGGVLTETERARLEGWYAQKDQEEIDLFGASAFNSLVDINGLRDDLTLAVTRLREKSQQLEAQAAKNDVLRREVDALSRKLVQK